MISAFHLLWIIPVTYCFGWCICAMCKVGDDDDDEFDQRQTAGDSKGGRR